MITLDGTPLEGADIQFIPKTEGLGEAAFGKSVSTGKFKVSSVRGLPEQGTMKGVYAVTVSKIDVVPLSQPKIDPVSGDAVTQTSKEIVPNLYQDTIKTPLEVTITEGINKVQLDLKTQP
jgi:hypothetical protein